MRQNVPVPNYLIAASPLKNDGSSRGGSGEAYATPPRRRRGTSRGNGTVGACPQVSQSSNKVVVINI